MKTRVWENASRLIGRLLVVMALILTGATVANAAPAETVVQDKLYRADGSAAHGNLTIRWNAFSTAAGEAVPAGQMTVATDANGGISIPLIPNAGATPAGGYYKVVVKLDDGTTSEENWVVPVGATTTLAVIRAKVVPQSVAAQFVSRDYVDAEFAGLAPVATSGSYSDLKNTPAIPNLAAPGTIGATTPGMVYATDVIAKSTPYADVRAYGDSGTCNTDSDDTTAFQAALNSVAYGGTVYAHNCKIGSVTFPNAAHSQWITLKIDGSLTLTQTLVVTSFVNIEGVAGGGSMQFGIGSMARIVAPSTGDVVKFSGNSSAISNIYIWAPVGYGLNFQFADFINVENVEIQGGTASTSAPVYIASGMHIYFDKCVFAQGTGASGTANPFTVKFSIDSPTGVDVPSSSWQEGSSIFFNRCKFFNYGIYIGGTVSMTGGSTDGFKFIESRYEMGHNPFLTLNTLYGSIGNIMVDNIDNEDGGNSWPFIYNTPNPGNSNAVYNVRLDHFMGQQISGGSILNPDSPPILGMYLEGESVPWGYAWTEPSTNWTWSGAGKTDTDMVGFPLSPIVLPYATQNLGFPQGTLGTNYTVTTGPDGLSSAYHYTNANGLNPTWSTSGVSITAAVGDWVIVGGWVKGDAGTQPGGWGINGNGVIFNNVNSGTRYVGAGTQYGRIDSVWQFVSQAFKVTAISGGTGNIAFSPSLAGSAPGYPASFAYPFVVYVPASAGVSDAEVVRWQRHLFKGIIPQNAAAGSMLLPSGAITPTSVTSPGTIASTNTTGPALQTTTEVHHARLRTMPVAVYPGTNEVDIGTFTSPLWGSNLHVNVAMTGGGVSTSKTYELSWQQVGSSFTWLKCAPITTSLPYAGNDFDMDIYVQGNAASLRLRRTAGTTAATAYITMTQSGGQDSFVDSTATSSAIPPTALFSSSYGVGGAALRVESGDNAGYTGTIGGTFTANRTITLPDLSGTLVVNNSPTFTGTPVMPQGNLTAPGLQIGASGYGFSNYAGNQLDIITGGVLSAFFGPNAIHIQNGSYSGQLQEATITGNHTYTLPDTDGNVVIDAATQTLSNKSLTAPNITGTINSAGGTTTFGNGTVTFGGGISAGYANFTDGTLQSGYGTIEFGSDTFFTRNGSGSLQLGSTRNGTDGTLNLTHLTVYNGASAYNYLISQATTNRNLYLPDGVSATTMAASLTTTAATSDNVAIQGMTSSGHCSLAATNASAATNIATTYISAKTANQITVTHTATASMNYDVLCTSN